MQSPVYHGRHPEGSPGGTLLLAHIESATPESPRLRGLFLFPPPPTRSPALPPLRRMTALPPGGGGSPPRPSSTVLAALTAQIASRLSSLPHPPVGPLPTPGVALTGGIA